MLKSEIVFRKKAAYGRFAGDELFCALVEEKQKRYENVLTSLESGDDQVYEFTGLGAESLDTPPKSQPSSALVPTISLYLFSYLPAFIYCRKTVDNNFNV